MFPQPVLDTVDIVNTLYVCLFVYPRRHDDKKKYTYSLPCAMRWR